MTFAKTQHFEINHQEIADIAKVLSHPARVAILEYLANQKDCCSGNISNEIPLSRTTVSQHLQELKKLGLIKGTIDGVKVCYCIDIKVYKKYKKRIEKFLEKITQNYSCCKK